MNNTFETNYNVIRANEFYYNNVDILDTPIYFEKLIDICDEGIDMNYCREFCKIVHISGVRYSSYKFREFVANHFGTTIEEMRMVKHFC